MKHFKEINRHSLCIETIGPDDGPVVIFLHHGLGAIHSWKGQISAFSQAGYQVITYDRWGHGKSAPRENYAMPYFEPDLADLEAILSEYNHRQVAFIGHSDGANIAMLYTLAHPKQVTCLVVVAAHIYIEPKMISGIQSVRKSFENDQRFRSGMQRVHGENTEPVFWGWFNGWTNPAIEDWDMRAEIKRISSPTLVVQGIEDEHASHQHARDLADSIPGAELWLVPGAGHMLPQQMPDNFNSRLLQYLDQVITVSTTEEN
ncbi:MAG: alpha/beta hydrolase [Chloroflexota bacterium]|nr:MAG: alpha/beta hydrolase [Chloroflexota bacterium]